MKTYTQKTQSVINKSHEGWKYFKGINHERLKKGKIDEAIVFQKLVELNALPSGSNFQPTKAWNNRVDFKDNSTNVTIEIKRRFLISTNEYPFANDPSKKSTLLTYGKFKYLQENKGWLYIQYNDLLFRVLVSTINDCDWVECRPFNVHHVSINLSVFDIID